MTGYLGMEPGHSYAFVDLPIDSAPSMLNIMAALGWISGGGHPLMNSPLVPPLTKGFVRVWGVKWSK